MTDVKVGDVFYRSWGYDQTNVNWAVVVEVSKTGKTAKLQEIGGVLVSDSSVAPDPELKPLSFTSRAYDYETGFYGDPVTTVEEPFTRRVKYSTWNGESEPFFNENSYSFWKKWNGEPKYQTPYGMGH